MTAAPQLIIQPNRTDRAIAPETARHAPEYVLLDFWQYFSIRDALKGFFRHLYGMKGFQNPERHTWRMYRRDLWHFLMWVNDHRAQPATLPTPDDPLPFPDRAMLDRYVLALKRRGIDNSTINRYMYPVKHFIKNLAVQNPISDGIFNVPPDQMPMLIQLLQQLTNKKAELLSLSQRKNERTEKRDPDPDQWLSPDEIRNLFEVARTTDQIAELSRLQTIAMLQIIFKTGLRLAEVSRLKLGQFERKTAQTYAIYVRRKFGRDADARQKPAICDVSAYNAVRRFVDAYNAGLAPDDARRITDDTPLWRAVDRWGKRRGSPNKPPGQLRPESVASRIKRVGQLADRRFSPHGARYSLALNSIEGGMKPHHTQKTMNHASLSTTMDIYVNKFPGWDTLNPVLAAGYLADL